jgi:protein-L-isoaspartate(D-aspartate) O-methyltransferase
MMEGGGYGGYRTQLVNELQSKGIRDLAVLRAISQVPRHLFIPESIRHRAYEDTALPIGSGQTISQPWVQARSLELARLTGRERVLEIGTGSGYQTAILAKLCRRVYTVERIRELLQRAEAMFERLHIRNVTAKLDDGSRGWPEQAPFDRILVTAAAAKVPETLLNQMGVDGIMVVPVGGDAEDQVLVRIRRDDAGFHHEFLTGVRFVPLVEGETA